MSVGPDGSLYVIDIHRKVIEHPEWIPDEIEKTLDLNAGKNSRKSVQDFFRKGACENFDFEQFSSYRRLIEIAREIRISGCEMPLIGS
jgi:hypothetical protein